MVTTQLFEDTTDGNRRSVLFSLGIMTAFISIVAATSVMMLSASNMIYTGILGLCGLLALGFSIAVYLGHFEGLLDDGQVIW